MLNKLIPLFLVLTACATTPAQSPTLYAALGGIDGIGTVVEGTLTRVHGDDRIAGLFESVDLVRLEKVLVEQICQATGGGCVYTGLPMEIAHKDLAITDEEFDIFVGHLVAAMTEAGVPPATQDRLAALLLPMRPQVVGL